MNAEYGKDDPFRDVATWDERTAAQWVELLRQRSEAADQIRLRRELLRTAGVKAGDHVLEIGCGIGVLLGDIARVVGRSGRVVGIDPQPRLAQAARDAVRRVPDFVEPEVRVGRADRLDFATGSFDVCLAQTVLIHLADSDMMRSLAEARRVLRAGGTFVTVDQDADTWTLDHPDRVLTRRIVQFNSDQRYADGWTGRRLHRLLRSAGFDDIRVQVVTQVDLGSDSYLLGMARRIAAAAAAAGALTEQEAAVWLGALDRRAAEGTFFSSMNYYVCAGREPQGRLPDSASSSSGPSPTTSDSRPTGPTGRTQSDFGAEV